MVPSNFLLNSASSYPQELTKDSPKEHRQESKIRLPYANSPRWLIALQSWIIPVSTQAIPPVIIFLGAFFIRESAMLQSNKQLAYFGVVDD